MARRQRPPTFLVLLVLAAIAFLAWLAWQQRHPAAPAAPPSGSIRIATWNLRKFSDRGQVNLVAIAELIKQSNFDLLAIQEVQQQGQEVQKLRRQLGEPWRHVISDRTGNNERFAFLYRSDRIELLGEPAFINSPDASIFDRAPFQATFRSGAFDFTLVTVHLSYTDTARRRREAEALARFAKDMASHGPERDIIVLGDFNEQRSHPNLTFFKSQGWEELNRDASNLSSTETFDNLLIDPRYTKEWTGQSGVVRFDETRFNNDDKTAATDVSDHRPVWADFSTLGPDDD